MSDNVGKESPTVGHAPAPFGLAKHDQGVFAHANGLLTRNRDRRTRARKRLDRVLMLDRHAAMRRIPHDGVRGTVFELAAHVRELRHEQLAQGEAGAEESGVRTEAPAQVAQGYEEAVAEYFRRLSRGAQ